MDVYDRRGVQAAFSSVRNDMIRDLNLTPNMNKTKSARKLIYRNKKICNEDRDEQGRVMDEEVMLYAW